MQFGNEILRLSTTPGSYLHLCQKTQTEIFAIQVAGRAGDLDTGLYFYSNILYFIQVTQSVLTTAPTSSTKVLYLRLNKGSVIH